GRLNPTNFRSRGCRVHRNRRHSESAAWHHDADGCDFQIHCPGTSMSCLEVVKNVGRCPIERQDVHFCKSLQAELKASIAFHLLSTRWISSNKSNPTLKRLFSGDYAGKCIGPTRLYSLAEPFAQIGAQCKLREVIRVQDHE